MYSTVLLCTHVSTFQGVWVALSSDGAAAEDHLILGESAGLVREDVVDLAQVLVDVQGTTPEGSERGRRNTQSAGPQDPHR